MFTKEVLYRFPFDFQPQKPPIKVDKKIKNVSIN